MSKSEIKDLKERMVVLEKKLEELEEKNQTLEKHVIVLESRVAISEKVSDTLSSELDRLDQYHRRSNIIIKNVFLPEHESDRAIHAKVGKVLEKDLKLPNVFNTIDKFHRVGKVRMKDGKKAQDIIVRFNNHSSRYAVYKERKKAQNVKIVPNLTRTRSKLLFDASQLVKTLESIEFCFANTHGDLYVRLVKEHEGNILHRFNSINELKKLISDMS